MMRSTYNEYCISELRKEAAYRGIPDYYYMKKNELVAALEETDPNYAGIPPEPINRPTEYCNTLPRLSKSMRGYSRAMSKAQCKDIGRSFCTSGIAALDKNTLVEQYNKFCQKLLETDPYMFPSLFTSPFNGPSGSSFAVNGSVGAEVKPNVTPGPIVPNKVSNEGTTYNTPVVSRRNSETRPEGIQPPPIPPRPQIQSTPSVVGGTSVDPNISQLNRTLYPTEPKGQPPQFPTMKTRVNISTQIRTSNTQDENYVLNELMSKLKQTTLSEHYKYAIYILLEKIYTHASNTFNASINLNVTHEIPEIDDNLFEQKAGGLLLQHINRIREHPYVFVYTYSNMTQYKINSFALISLIVSLNTSDESNAYKPPENKHSQKSVFYFPFMFPYDQDLHEFVINYDKCLQSKRIYITMAN